MAGEGGIGVSRYTATTVTPLPLNFARIPVYRFIGQEIA